jgi:hypothetical protein
VTFGAKNAVFETNFRIKDNQLDFVKYISIIEYFLEKILGKTPFNNSKTSQIIQA